MRDGRGFRSALLADWNSYGSFRTVHDGTPTMLNRRVMEWLLVSPLVLGGCSAAEFAPTSPSLTSVELSQSDYRRLVADNIKEVFPNQIPSGEMAISPPRVVDHLKGVTRLSCLRIDAAGSPSYYAIFIQLDKVVDSRVGVIKDQCHKEAYEPFEIAREATPAEVMAPVSARSRRLPGRST